LAPEPVPEREAMPALTLAASGSDLQLTFTLRDAVDTAAASIWIERTLLQAAVGDDGIAYRARFRIRRWLSDSIDVHWPEALAEATPEAFLDEPAHPVPVALVPHGSGRLFRIALPEPKMGRSIILEIRYRLPNRPGELLNFVAPEPVAAYAGPVRWLATGPAGTVPLLISGGRSEQRWRLRQGFLEPLSISGPDLERWFQNGSTDDSAAAETEAVAVRLISPSAISVYSISRINLIIGCSLGVLVLGLMLSRLPGGLAGPLVAIAGGAVAVAAVCYPQPAAQAAAAAEPGLAGLILILSVQTFSRWRYRHRVTYLPGFTRTLPEASPSSTGGSKPSGRVVPSQNGSTGSVVAPIPTLSSRSST